MRTIWQDWKLLEIETTIHLRTLWKKMIVPTYFQNDNVILRIVFYLSPQYLIFFKLRISLVFQHEYICIYSLKRNNLRLISLQQTYFTHDNIKPATCEKTFLFRKESMKIILQGFARKVGFTTSQLPHFSFSYCFKLTL